MKAFFAGSFNPFTKGHLDILARGLRLFPEGVVIGIGFNEHKTDRASADAVASELRELFDGVKGVEVAPYSGLTVDAARAAGAGVLLRGFRNAIDAEYERTLADANRLVGGMDTVLLPSRPELSPVSSSLVRELRNNGRDTSRFIPTQEECRRACRADSSAIPDIFI